MGTQNLEEKAILIQIAVVAGVAVAISIDDHLVGERIDGGSLKPLDLRNGSMAGLLLGGRSWRIR